MPTPKHAFLSVWFASGLGILIFGALFLFYITSQGMIRVPTGIKACPSEAEQCPDGSFVQRTGPDCAFAPCPDEYGDSTNIPNQNPRSGWLTSTDEEQQIHFQYPAAIGTSYVEPDAWPPKLQRINETLICEDNSIMMNGFAYCVSKEVEVAAGSSYTTYRYQLPAADDMSYAEVSFVIRTVQCLNYDEPRQSDCLTEQRSFDPDTLAMLMLTSVSAQ